MPETGGRRTGKRQGSVYKHFRHIRTTIGCCKVSMAQNGMCCCCRVNLLAVNFLTLKVNLYSLATVTQCSTQGGSSSIARSPAPAQAPSKAPALSCTARVAGLPITLLSPPDIVSLFRRHKLLASLPIGHILTTKYILVHVRPPPSSIASLTARGPRHHQTSSACHPRRQCHQTAAILRLATVAVPWSAGAHPTPRLAQAIPLRYVSSRRSAAVLR